jgi:chlorobactene glucosyltransferase
VIDETIRAALAYPDQSLEVLLLDDHSTDGTGDIALAAAGGDSRFRVIKGEALPDGWLGKNWACWQLAQAATGKILIFADADVRWSPDGLPAVLGEIERGRADMLTVWSTQITVSWGERLVVPLMALVILGYLPALLVNNTRWATFAAANGQCLAFRRAAYQKIGGHEAVKDQIVEDIQLAKRAKRAGLRFRMADGSNLVRCRMYHGWAQVRDGYAKNIIAGYGGVVGLLLGTLFHWLIFLCPWLWLFFGGIPAVHAVFAPFAYPAYPLALILVGILIRALTAAITRQRVGDAIFMSVSALLMTVIAGQAFYWRTRYGGVLWKGRVIKGS